MSRFVGACIWDSNQIPHAWNDLASTVPPERGLTISSDQGLCLVRWKSRPNVANVQTGRAGSIAVVVFGAARARPDAPCRPNLPDYVAQALVEGQSLEALLAEMDGEFVLLAWDAATGTAFLAVDPMGHHALYYSLRPGRAVWASHPQEIARLTAKPQLDREALNLYLALKGIPAPWSILAGTRKVRPGHVLELTYKGTDEREYWPLLEQAAQCYEGDLALARDELLTLLRLAIQRYVEDVPYPVGIFLSGGVDSTAVMALARRAGIPLRAFSVSYSPPHRGDESDYARLAASKIGVPIETCRFSPRDAARLARDVIPRLPEPVADMALLPQLFLGRHAAEQVQVMLDGTGADGVLGGSNKYLAEHYSRFYLRIPRLLRLGVIAPLSCLLPASRRWQLTDLARKWQFFITGCELSPTERSLFWTRFLPHPVIARLLRSELLVSEDLGAACLRGCWQQVGAGGVSTTSYLTLKRIMPWVELLKLTSLEQESGISVRKPFLSPALVEFGLRLPDACKVRGSQGKIVLRQACDGLVPPAILKRRKANFVPPIGQWLRRDLREMFWEVVLEEVGLFDVATIRRMMQEHNAGWRDWSSELWAIFVLQYWWITNRQQGETECRR